MFALGQQGMLLVGEAAAGPAGLLLDTYTGAAAAYATMKLRADADSCMVIRRSSDNATQLIGFSGDDIDESTITTFCSATDCFVVRWCDQTGQGRDVTQTTVANQPQVVSGGTLITDGGILAVDFDGSNDYLEFLGDLNFSSYANAFGAVVFDVANPNDTWFGLSDGGYSANNHWIFTGTYNSGAAYMSTKLNAGDPNGRVQNQAISSVIPTNTIVVSIQHETDGSTISSAIYIDGSADGTDSDSVTPTHSMSNIDYDLTIGAIVNYGSPIIHANIKTQCLIIYNSDQSANRTSIETIINNYYSIY